MAQSRVRTKTAAEDVHRLAAQEAELETLRETTESAPYLVWREGADGTPIWVNRAYLETVRKTYGNERVAAWPLPRLFPTLGSTSPERRSLALIEQKQRERQLGNAGVDFAGDYDYVQMAQAFGGDGYVIRSRGELSSALERALAADRFSLLACEIDRQAYDGRL